MNVWRKPSAVSGGCPCSGAFLLLFVGGYALFRPGMTMGVLTQVIGAFVIADGILSITAGIMAQIPSRGWVIARGALEILAGAFVFANPIMVAGITATVLISVLAFTAILTGVLEIVAAIQDRKQIEGEGWLILGGSITVLFGVVLLAAPLSFGLFMVRVLGGDRHFLRSVTGDIRVPPARPRQAVESLMQSWRNGIVICKTDIPAIHEREAVESSSRQCRERVSSIASAPLQLYLGTF